MNNNSETVSKPVSKPESKPVEKPVANSKTERLQAELAELIEKAHAEKDLREKKKIIQQISKTNGELERIKSGKLLQHKIQIFFCYTHRLMFA